MYTLFKMQNKISHRMKNINLQIKSEWRMAIELSAVCTMKPSQFLQKVVSYPFDQFACKIRARISKLLLTPGIDFMEPISCKNQFRCGIDSRRH